jgi:hypothetical protein
MDSPFEVCKGNRKAGNAWPNFLFFAGSAGRQTGISADCNQNAQLAPSEITSLLEIVDGRMASAATRRKEEDLVRAKKQRIDVTPTGLLMKGVCALVIRPF